MFLTLTDMKTASCELLTFDANFLRVDALPGMMTMQIGSVGTFDLSPSGLRGQGIPGRGGQHAVSGALYEEEVEGDAT